MGMRDYGKVSPQFWTGKTGKALRGKAEAQIVAMYLMTSPHANMIGVYHLPMLYLSHETGLSAEGAGKGLADCVEQGFCVYDEESETVFVVEMAVYQVGESLKESDNRTTGVKRQFKAISSQKIASAFYDRYGEPFNLESPPKAPCKGLQKGLPKPLYPVPAPSTAPAPVEDEWFPGVPPQVVADFRKLRQAKKAAITKTAVDGIAREAAKAGLTLAAALAMCCERGWTGFKAEWVTGDTPKPAKQRVAL